MTKKQIKITPTKKIDSGISFNYSGAGGEKNKFLSAVIGTIFGFVVVLLLSLGALYTFITMFDIPINDKVFLSVVPAFILVITIIFMLPKKAMLWSLLGVAINVLGFIYHYYKYIPSGYIYIRDKVVAEVCTSMNWPYPIPSYTFEDSMKKDTTIVILIVSLFLIIAVGFFTVRKVNFLLGFLITFIFFESGAAFGCIPNHNSFAILLAGWVGLFAMFCSGRVKVSSSSMNKKTGKIAVRTKKSIIAIIGAFMSIVALATFALGNFLVVKVGYNRSDSIETMRTDIRENANQFVEELLEGGKDGVLNEGKLYKLETRVLNKSRQLTLEMPYTPIVYLRGYIGENYCGDRWEDVYDTNAYDELYNTYNSTGYYPQKQQGILLDKLRSESSKVDKAAVTITISNIKKKKMYAYLAYVPSIPENFSIIGDSLVAPDNRSSYSYTAYVDSASFYMVNGSAMFNDDSFLKVMQDYSAYVKNQYTVVPEGLDEVKQIVDDLVYGEKYGYSTIANNSLEIANRIREYLSDNIQYSLVSKKLPKNQDFVNHFLFNSKKGYAPHYATAMAVMLRMAGIPTRYVEGYVALKENFDSGKKLDNGNYTIDLTDTNSHAWVEVYETNYGWIPLETTPGFYTGTVYEGFGLGAFGSSGVNPNYSSGTQNGNSEQPLKPKDEELPKTELDKIEPIKPEKPKQPDLKSEKKNIFIVFLKWIAISVGLIVCVILSTILILILRRYYNLQRFKVNMSSNNRSKKIKKLYSYYNRLLKFEKIENTQKLPYLKYAEKVGNISTMLSKEQHLHTMDIFLKYRFSYEGISDEELEYIQKTLTDYRNEFLVTLKKLDKLRFMYINNLG